MVMTLRQIEVFGFAQIIPD